jgi:hypothetical protein
METPRSVDREILSTLVVIACLGIPQTPYSDNFWVLGAGRPGHCTPSSGQNFLLATDPGSGKLIVSPAHTSIGLSRRAIARSVHARL